MKKIVLLASLLFAPILRAEPALYEGFDLSGAPGTTMGSMGTGGGETSIGWMSSWTLWEGVSKYQKNDLSIPGFVSAEGLLSNSGGTAVMRQLGHSINGDVYGSFRVRAERLRENSIMGLLFSLPPKEGDKVNVKTAILGFMATSWASPLGAVSIGGNVVKVPAGEGMVEGEEILYLWKINNLPEPGKRSNQVIQVWILSAEQASHFARVGLTEKVLEEAGLGRGSHQVLQTVKTSLTDSRLTLVKGLVVSCFSFQVPDAKFDEIRISKVSLADAAGVDPTSAGE